MASYEQVDHTWTRRQMTAECSHRGLRSYARLNKDQLIRFLNRNLDANTTTTRAVVVSAASQAVGDSDRAAPASGRAAGNSNEPPSRRDDRAVSASGRAVSSSERTANSEEGGRRIDDSWTVRELKAECGRRGLRRFARLTKPGLLALLHRGSSVSVAPPPERSGGGTERLPRLQSVPDLKERADGAFRSSQFTLAIELSSQAIGFLSEDALIHIPGPLENHTRALLLAIRAEARATVGITMEAKRDCAEALRLKPDLSKMLLLKARLNMRMCEWELATQNFQAYLITDGVSDVSRRVATAELEQCRRTQVRSVDQQLQRMDAMLSGVRASMRLREGATGLTPGLRGSRAADAEAPETIRVAETGARVEDGSGWSDEERVDDRTSGGGTASFSRSDSNPTQAAVPVGERSGTSAAATSNRSGGNGGSCVVCMDSTVTCTFVPCGHFCCCDSCAGRVGACPVCRSEVEHSIRTFMP